MPTAPMPRDSSRRGVPNRMLSFVREGAELDSHAGWVPLLSGKTARGGRVSAYVCENRVCKLLRPTRRSSPSRSAR
jgi:hypothetical protein